MSESDSAAEYAAVVSDQEMQATYSCNSACLGAMTEKHASQASDKSLIQLEVCACESDVRAQSQGKQKQVVRVSGKKQP